MKTIWKFVLEFDMEQAVEMPESPEFLSVGQQDGKICLWALVDTDKEKAPQLFRIFGTEANLPTDRIQRDMCRYIGTVQINQYVWHVFHAGEL